MTNPESAMLRATVSGRVQGVGFRYFVCRIARARGITGWVQNNPEGTVTLEAFGLRASLNEFLERVSSGPTVARVDNISVEWMQDEKERSLFSGFSSR